VPLQQRHDLRERGQSAVRRLAGPHQFQELQVTGGVFAQVKPSAQFLPDQLLQHGARRAVLQGRRVEQRLHELPLPVVVHPRAVARVVRVHNTPRKLCPTSRIRTQ
jgi:hypothetical protein